MEERQTQVRVGAGLEESRLNQEFLDFLRRWSTPILLILALVAVGYWFMQRQKKARNDRTDAAFRELEQERASTVPNLENLRQVASTYSGVGAVSALAHLEAADTLAFTLVTGLTPGAALDKDGNPQSAEDLLSEEDRAKNLAEAERLYQQAYDEASGNLARRPIALSALFGLASLAESKQDFAKAKERYEQIVKMTEGTAFDAKAQIAKHRIEAMGSLKDLPALFNESQLPKLPDLPGATPAPAAPPGVTVEPVAAPPFAVQPQGPSSTPDTAKPDAPKPATPTPEPK